MVKKIAAIDCGSNSTRLLVASVDVGKLKTIYKIHKVTKTSEGLESSGEISQDARKRLISTLRGYLKKINYENVNEVLITGTAVFRDALNSQAVIDEVKNKLGIEIQIISGQDEGILTSLGVFSSSSIVDNYFIVDIGGRSTELIYDYRKQTRVESLDLGVVSLSEKILTSNPISDDEKQEAKELIDMNIHLDIDTTSRSMIGVSGTFTSIASIFLDQKKYDEDEIHLTSISYSWISELSSVLNNMTEAKIISIYPSLDPKRAKTLSAGVLIVRNIMKKFKFDELKVSKSDILEGLILKYN
tara:strand:- start:3404 stop:4306 length:903 start_codon:yes stop_codon:yes gene_type:complete